MGLDCRGLCKDPKYKFPRQGGNSLLYLQGAKRCQNCEGKYLKWEGIFCPCCGGRLRLKPRKSKLKETVLNNKSIGRI